MNIKRAEKNPTLQQDLFTLLKKVPQKTFLEKEPPCFS